MPSRRGVFRHEYALQEQRSVTLDDDGAGTIIFFPGGARERWLISLVNVTCTQLTTINVPTMIMYRSAPVPAYQIGGTYTATLDSDSSDRFLLNMNELVYCVFTGGDPTAVGTVRLEGTRYVWE